jgi:hypothetical protein
MTRLVPLIAAVALAVWPARGAAQQSSHLVVVSHSGFTRASTAWTADGRFLSLVSAPSPARVSWSTAPLVRLPASVSWTRSHTALASGFVVTLLIDAAQTRALASHGWTGFRESNPLLGERPTVGQVNTYTAVAALSVLGAAAALPPRVRPWLLGAAIAVQAFTIGSSVRQGLPIRFP